MNREIKFRQAIFFSGKFHSFHYWGFLKNDNNFVSPQCSNQDALANSQEFTGLKDREGNEVWEGDIIQIDDVDQIYFVKYFGDSDYPAFDLSPCWDSESNGLSDLCGNEYHWKVIGNLFENPELLN